MLNIPETVKALFKADGIRKNFRVQFPGGELPDITNENIVQESVKFTESLCSQDVLKFGLTEASVIEFETVGVANMYGMTIEAGIEIDLSSLSAAEIAEIAAGSWDGVYVSETDTDIGFPFFRVPYGVFRVESCPRDHQAMTHRRVQAYSMGSARKNIDIASGMLWETITAEPNALLAASTGIGLTVLDELTSIGFNYPDQSFLFDSSGNSYLIDLRIGENGDVVCGAGNIYRGQSSYENDPCDFLRMDASGLDLEAYDAFGVSVAALLTSRGWNLTYNKSGNKIYGSNEEALRRCQPWLFAPGIMYRAVDTTTTDNKNVFPLWQPIVSGYPQPVICPEELAADYPCGFSIQNNGYKISFASFYCLVNTSTESAVTVYLNAAPNGTVTKQGFFESYPQVERLKTSGNIGFHVIIKNSGSLSRQFVKQAQSAGTLQSASLTSYDFNNIDVLRLAEGVLEINASFAKQSRSGGFEIVRLDNSEAETIPPGEFSQFWWDEYDVLPIGTVDYTTTGEENNQTAVAYQFSGDPSIYDMTDNVLVPAIDSQEPATVNEILDSLFIPYLEPIAFTPIDLDMKGLPYLEAGDYLAVTAGDGATAYSFAMRQEISGVQVLTAHIESTSGDIIESGESE